MRLLHNARIHTLDTTHPIASAIAIDAGHILALGGDELLVEFEPAECEDMGGGVILPGLTDAHIHLQEYALSLQIVDCEGKTKEEILCQVKERLQQTLHGVWVRGHGWDQNAWGGVWPTAGDLEAVASENPVFLTAKSMHVAWVNSTALKLAGINSSTPDPVNGRIQRDARGLPTGILFEGAMRLVEAVIPEPTPETLALNFRQVIAGLWRMGLTGVHDFDKRTCFQALQLLRERGDLQFRITKAIPLELFPQAVSLGMRSGFGDDFLRIRFGQIFC